MTCLRIIASNVTLTIFKPNPHRAADAWADACVDAGESVTIDLYGPLPLKLMLDARCVYTLKICVELSNHAM